MDWVEAVVLELAATVATPGTKATVCQEEQEETAGWVGVVALELAATVATPGSSML